MEAGVRRIARLALFLCALLTIAAGVRADVTQTILHEFIPADAREDVQLSATTPDGSLPAAMNTPSGTVQAPDTARLPTATEKSYGGSQSSTSVEKIFNPDLDTRRPNVSRYDDPFSPSTAPYKRLRAFDMVREDFSLTVADPTVRNIAPAGGSALGTEESFFGDITVDLVPGEGVSIPTVGPGARLLKMVTVPPIGVTITADGADNWYARSNVRARVRLVQLLAISRDTFGGMLRDVPLATLRARPVPDPVRRSALEVARAIGLPAAGTGTLREVITPMVAWFRSFEPSEDPPRGRENKYLDLALSKKGVCRHRAYAFTITALALGVPTRLVVNEAHAWVEVFDSVLWRRIDLGGAAAHIEQDTNDGRPQHRNPQNDPYAWPARNDSGEDSAQRSRAEQGPTGNNRNPNAPAPVPAPTGMAPDNTQERIASGASKVAIVQSDTRVMRGSPLRIEGTVMGSSGGCAHLRVDVALLDTRASREIPVGSLSTDEQGKYQGAVVIPLEVPVGDYDLVVTTPGDGACGAGRSAG